MKYQLFPSNERGQKDAGWLKSNFVFSFSDFYHPMRSAFGTLVAFNDDYLTPGKGFGNHPHQNMEIISVMLKGSMNHKDDMGHVNIVHECSVQIMSAGSGLFHEEWNIGDEEVNFLQIWVQPKLQNIRPRYQFRHFPKKDRVNQMRTIISSEEGAGHCWINQNTRMQLGNYAEASRIEYNFNPVNKALFLFVMEGSLSIDNLGTLQKRDAVGIWDTSSISIDIAAGTEFLLIETVINQK
jgi:quercetin 2,3-dioxygenase